MNYSKKRMINMTMLHLGVPTKAPTVRNWNVLTPTKGMRLLNAKNHLCHIPFCDRFGKNVVTNEKPQEVTTRHIIHDQVKMIEILETCSERYHPLQIQCEEIRRK